MLALKLMNVVGSGHGHHMRRVKEVLGARCIHFDLGRQSSHLQDPGVGKGTMGKDMLLESEE